MLSLEEITPGFCILDHKNGQHFIIPQIADRYGNHY